MTLLPRPRSCFACGVENPLGLALPVASDGRTVSVRFRFRPEFVGFRKTVHGGVTATVLDEVMAWVCGAVAGRFAYCAELRVRFHRPVAPGVEVLASGWLEENRRERILLCRAELRVGDELCAAGEGKYIPVGPSELAEFRSDFVEDPEPVFRHLRASHATGSSQS